jgi:hypothetical protein
VVVVKLAVGSRLRRRSDLLRFVADKGTRIWREGAKIDKRLAVCVILVAIILFLTLSSLLYFGIREYSSMWPETEWPKNRVFRTHGVMEPVGLGVR